MEDNTELEVEKQDLMFELYAKLLNSPKISNDNPNDIETAQENDDLCYDIRQFLTNNDSTVSDTKWIKTRYVQIWRLLQSHKNNKYPQLCIQNNPDNNKPMIYYLNKNKKSKLFIPDRIRHQIIHNYHTTMFNHHPGISQTYRKIQQKYYWPLMEQDVKNVIGGCLRTN